jgi:hypothetical protein
MPRRRLGSRRRRRQAVGRAERRSGRERLAKQVVDRALRHDAALSRWRLPARRVVKMTHLLQMTRGGHVPARHPPVTPNCSDIMKNKEVQSRCQHGAQRKRGLDASDNRLDPRAGRLRLGLGSHEERAPPARRRVRLAGCAGQPGYLQQRCQVRPPRPPCLQRPPRSPRPPRPPECLHGWTWRRSRWLWAT